ncbi:MAG: hypothetical protein K940chlam2_00456, partial [Chlamydiae bacterium]|nr:hypothetical protein [Chlamydiota bacterium]
MRQSNLLLTLSSLCALSTGFAEDCCCQETCSYEETCCSEPDWVITPSAGPCVDCGADVFVTAEFIYWITREDNLAFAKTEDKRFTGEKTTTELPDFRFEPGFKVGLGYFSDCDGWDLYLKYTWLRTRNTNASISGKDNLEVEDYLWATNTYFGLGNFIISKESFDWEHDFNVIDLTLGRNFYVSHCLALHPRIGLKGSWQAQRATAKTEEFFVNILQFTHSEGKHTNDYGGVGATLGLNTTWEFSQCFALIGDFALSGLWGKFTNTSKVTLTFNHTDEQIVPYNTGFDFFTLKHVFEFLLG